MKKIVRIDAVSKKFREGKLEFYALKDVSFDIKEGEIFGLLGPNGAGKTTLINILTTVLLPDSGTVEVLGFDVTKNPYEILEMINTVSGETRFHYLLKVRDIMKFYSRLYGISKADSKERVDYLMKEMEATHLMDKLYRGLSSGERMRVTLVKAFLNKPRLLLLDEPTIGLDPDIAVKTRELIKQINKAEGTTILLTSHYMHEVEQLCERVAFIDGGIVSDIGTIEALKSKKFSTYHVRIGVVKVKYKDMLVSQGFKINGNVLTKDVDNREDPAELIRFLVNKGYDVISFETKHPTLEDYFIKMTRDRK